jgi:hypothetical protein
MKTLHSTSAVTYNVQEPKSEARQNKDTYRAPRLVPLGTAVDLVQGGSGGRYGDGWRGWSYA